MNDLREMLPTGLIVSLHVDEIETMNKLDLTLMFAAAAEQGGAVGLRVEGVPAVTALRPRTGLPIVAFVKGEYSDGSVLITPQLDDVAALFDAGADIVAVDATRRKRPGGLDGFLFLEEARKRFSRPLWADCATFREGVRAAESGADAVASTLSGLAGFSGPQDYRTPDLEMIGELSSSLLIPVMAEGRIWTPEDAVDAILAGAHCAVAGSAITRPRIITHMFAEAMRMIKED